MLSNAENLSYFGPVPRARQFLRPALDISARMDDTQFRPEKLSALIAAASTNR